MALQAVSFCFLYPLPLFFFRFLKCIKVYHHHCKIAWAFSKLNVLVESKSFGFFIFMHP